MTPESQDEHHRQSAHDPPSSVETTKFLILNKLMNAPLHS